MNERAEQPEDLVGEDADEQLELIADDRPPFTMCPDWLMFAPGVSPQAKTLWWALAAHVNNNDPSRKADPTRETLAELLCLSRPQSVDRYLLELEELGALRKERRRLGRMKVRNRYYIRFNLPSGHAGPADIGEFYRRRRAAANVRNLAAAALGRRR